SRSRVARLRDDPAPHPLRDVDLALGVHGTPLGSRLGRGLRRSRYVRTISADWVVPLEGPPISDGAVAIADDGTIAAVGPAADLGRGDHYPESVVLPAFVNAHTHLEYEMYAGFGDGLGFAEWIGLHVARKQRIDLDDMEAIARLGALHCLRSG